MTGYTDLFLGLIIVVQFYDQCSTTFTSQISNIQILGLCITLYIYLNTDNHIIVKTEVNK